MRRLSTVFLAVFVALVIGLAGVVAWKVTSRRLPATAAPAHEADYRVNEIHISETLAGNLRWALDADRAEVYDEKRRTEMQQVVIHLYSDDAVWTVTADEGVLNNDDRDIELSGNVVVTSDDGLRMTTPKLYWRNGDRNLFTDRDVEITRPGTTITGRGLDVRMQTQAAVIPDQVRVVITNRANANLALFPRSGS